MVRYAVCSGATSAGVFIRRSIMGVITMPTTVNTTPSSSVSSSDVWTACLTFSSRCAP